MNRQPSINLQPPVASGVIIVNGAGAVSISPGARGIASVAFGAAANQLDLTFEEPFSDNRYVSVTSGLVLNRLAHFLVSNPPQPGGLTTCEVFVSTIDAAGVPVPTPDLLTTSAFFSIIVTPSA